MKFVKQFGPIFLFLAAILLLSCSGNGDGGGTGTLSVALTDSSTAKYLAIYVTIDEVQVNRHDSSSNANSGWETVANPMKTYNLLKLVNGVTETLGEDELAAGTYQQIRLIIGKTPESENNILGLPHEYPNYIILNDAAKTVEPLKIPSGFNTGIKLVHNFEVEEGTVVELLLDFEACKSVVETGSGKYLLKPTIKVIGTEAKFELYGQVTDAGDGVIEGALVSAQISDGFSATTVRSTLTDEDGNYSMLLSPLQTYNIVAYPEPPEPLEDGDLIYLPACEEILAPIEEDIVELTFPLEQGDFGTISGDITVDTEIDDDNPPVVSISFFKMLDCGYVEIASLPMSPDEGTNTFSFSANLPFGDYDVVASSDGFVAQTGTASISEGETSANVDPNPLVIEEYPSSQ